VLGQLGPQGKTTLTLQFFEAYEENQHCELIYVLTLDASDKQASIDTAQALVTDHYLTESEDILGYIITALSNTMTKKIKHDTDPATYLYISRICGYRSKTYLVQLESMMEG